jgi:hypothetical protein
LWFFLRSRGFLVVAFAVGILFLALRSLLALGIILRPLLGAAWLLCTG